MRGNQARLCLRGLLIAALVAALSSCISLPRSGEVRTVRSDGDSQVDNAPYYAPPGPRPGGSPVQIASGFLDAMTANPLSTSVAQKFLATDARPRWRPERATVVYSESPLSARGNEVSLTLDSADRLDSRGAWLGRAATPTKPWPLKMVLEKGEWRISHPPDALVIPSSYFEDRFYQASLYFFDETAQVLVPEPVYVPRGPQAATTLVRGLLKGPGDELDGVIRTFFPAETAVDLSVPVVGNGTAEVPLSAEVLDLSPDDLERMSVQLSWTLRQVLGVARIRVTVDGNPLTLADGSSVIPVDAGAEYDPSVIWASRDLFGVREGRVVRVSGGSESRVAGPYGAQQLAPRSIAVDLAGEHVAAVDATGSTVTVSPVTAAVARQDTRQVFEGADLLKPAYDLHGDLWLVDRTAGGAVVWVVHRGLPQPVEVSGVTGAVVSHFLISRDGSRLVAVVASGSADRVVVSRIVRTEDGAVKSGVRGGVLDPVPSVQDSGATIRDLGWRSATSLALLTGAAGDPSELQVESIDGSPGVGDLSTTPQDFQVEASAVVTEPSPGSPLYVTTDKRQMFQLSSGGRWTGTSLGHGLTAVTFVG